jgi:hypothetical protein
MKIDDTPGIHPVVPNTRYVYQWLFLGLIVDTCKNKVKDFGMFLIDYSSESGFAESGKEWSDPALAGQPPLRQVEKPRKQKLGPTEGTTDSDFTPPTRQDPEWP